MGTADSSRLKAFGMTTFEAWVEQLCGKGQSNPSTSLTAQKNLCVRSPAAAHGTAGDQRLTPSRRIASSDLERGYHPRWRYRASVIPCFRKDRRGPADHSAAPGAGKQNRVGDPPCLSS